MQLENQQVQQTLDRLIPADSPSCDYFQNIFIHLVTLQPFLIELNNYELDETKSQRDFTEIQAAIRREKKTDDWEVSYLLASFLPRYQNNKQALDFLGKYLQVLLLIAYRNNGHDKKVKNLCLRIRMALDEYKSQHIILTTLLEIHQKNKQIPQVFEKLQNFENEIKASESSGKGHNENLSQKIGQIRYAYEVAYRDLNAYNLTKSRRAKSHRKGTQRLGGDVESDNILASNTLEMTLDDTPVRTLAHIKLNNDSNIPENEQLADTKIKELADNSFEPSSETKYSNQLQAQKTRNSYNHSKRNQFLFPTNSRLHSIENYQRLFSLVWQRFHTVKDEDKNNYGAILLTLLTGRSLKQVYQELATDPSKREFIVVVDKQTQAIGFRTTIDVTKNRRDSIKPIRKSQTYFINFELPLEIQPLIRRKFVINEDNVTAIIQGLRQELQFGSLYPQNVDICLRFLLQQILHQPLHATIITGVDVKHASPLYYTSVERNAVLISYQQAMALLSTKASPPLDQAWVKPENLGEETVFFGSEIALKDTIVKRYFAELANWVTSYNGRKFKDSPSGDEYLLQYQAYTLWLWCIFMLLAGLRPVNDAPGYLNQINIEYQLLWVSDKEIRSSDSGGRLIPMCDFLIHALQNYLNFIRQFAFQHNVAGLSNSYPLEEILTSKRPLLQLYNFKRKKFENIKPRTVGNALKDFLPHQDNWLRHQARTLLTGKVDENLICAFFGHELADQEFWHPFSSMSLNAYKTLRNAVENMANHLELEQLEVF